MMIKNIDTPESLIEFYSICKAKQACEPPMLVTEEAIANGWTLRELINKTVTRPEYAVWARWLRMNMSKELPTEINNSLTYKSLESVEWANQLESVSYKSIVEQNLLRNKRNEEWQ